MAEGGPQSIDFSQFDGYGGCDTRDDILSSDDISVIGVVEHRPEVFGVLVQTEIVDTGEEPPTELYLFDSLEKARAAFSQILEVLGGGVVDPMDWMHREKT